MVQYVQMFLILTCLAVVQVVVSGPVRMLVRISRTSPSTTLTLHWRALLGSGPTSSFTRYTAPAITQLHYRPFKCIIEKSVYIL